MAKASAEHARKARGAAALTALAVALFAAAFVGLVMGLDQIAVEQHQRQQQQKIEDSGTSRIVDSFYVLLIGSDTRKGTALYTGKAAEHAQVDQHSDIMTLMRIDPAEYKISLLTIPRDTVLDGQKGKINDALLNNDPNEVVDAVQELCGMRPDYYMMTTFSSFESLIDAIGGITVDVPQDISVADPGSGGTITVKAGKDKHLDGAEALALARARHEYGEDQDVLRQANVRAIEMAIIDKVLSSPNDIDMEKLVTAISDDIETDCNLALITPTMVDFIEHASDVTFYEGTGPYDGGPRKDDGQWVIPEDSKTWAKIMKHFKRGEDFSDIIKVPSF